MSREALEITVTRDNLRGMMTLSAIYAGRYFSRRYFTGRHMGYTVKDAKADFRAMVRAEVAA